MVDELAEDDSTVDNQLAANGNVNRELFAERYGLLKTTKFPKLLSEAPKESFADYLDELETDFNDICGGLSEIEMSVVLRNKPSALLFKDAYEKDKTGLLALQAIFTTKHGISFERVTDLVVRLPAYLSKTEDDLEKYLKDMADYGIEAEAAFSLLERAPRLISYDAAKQLSNKEFFFQLYHKFERADYLEIVHGFPYLLCVPDRKV